MGFAEKASQIAAVRILVPDRDGTLDWIDGDNQATAVPGVAEVKFYLGPNMQIVRKGDHWDWIGHVIAASFSRDQTKATLQHAVDSIDRSIASTLGEKEPSAAPTFRIRAGRHHMEGDLRPNVEAIESTRETQVDEIPNLFLTARATECY